MAPVEVQLTTTPSIPLPFPVNVLVVSLSASVGPALTSAVRTVSNIRPPNNHKTFV